MTRYRYLLRVTFDLWGITGRELYASEATSESVALFIAATAFDQDIACEANFAGVPLSEDDPCSYRVRLIEVSRAEAVLT